MARITRGEIALESAMHTLIQIKFFAFACIVCIFATSIMQFRQAATPRSGESSSAETLPADFIETEDIRPTLKNPEAELSVVDR